MGLSLSLPFEGSSPSRAGPQPEGAWEPDARHMGCLPRGLLPPPPPPAGDPPWALGLGNIRRTELPWEAEECGWSALPQEPVPVLWGGHTGPDVPSNQGLDLTLTLTALWVQLNGGRAAWGVSGPVRTLHTVVTAQAPIPVKGKPPPQCGAGRNH